MCLSTRCRCTGTSMIGRDRINSDTGNKDWMICIKYASSVSMSHLQQQRRLLASCFHSLYASIRSSLHPKLRVESIAITCLHFIIMGLSLATGRFYAFRNLLKQLHLIVIDIYIHCVTVNSVSSPVSYKS